MAAVTCAVVLLCPPELLMKKNSDFLLTSAAFRLRSAQAG
jgi:hypothetical protein